MIAALRATQTAEIQGGLPEKLEITMNEIVSAACPTHMLASTRAIRVCVHVGGSGRSLQGAE
jgi:hypothetical protein